MGLSNIKASKSIITLSKIILVALLFGFSLRLFVWETLFGTTTRMLLFSADGEVLLGAGGVLGAHDGEQISGEIRSWDTQTGYLKQTLTCPGKHNIFWTSYSADNRTIVGCDQKNNCWSWDIKTSAAKPVKLSIISIDSVKCWFPNSVEFVYWKNVLHHFKKAVEDVDHSYGEIVAISKNLKWAAVRNKNGVEFWNVLNEKCLRIMLGEESQRGCIALSADGKLMTTGDTKIRLWNTQTGKLIKTINNPFVYVNAIALSPDNNKIAIANGYGQIKVWDVNARQFVLFVHM